MKRSIGCPARIIARVPQAGKLAALRSAGLSEKRRSAGRGAGLVLQEISPAFGWREENAALTCRHFGTRRSRFYRRLARYDKTRLVPPGPGSTAPERKREAEYSRAPVAQVRWIRNEDPAYSGKKIRPILLRSMAAADVPSVPAPGRLVNRENLFFRPDTKLHRKRPEAAVKGHERKKKPAGLKADGPNKVTGYDMKHVYLLGNKLYTYRAIDPCTKQAVLRIGTTAPGLNSRSEQQGGFGRGGQALRAGHSHRRRQRQ